MTARCCHWPGFAARSRLQAQFQPPANLPYTSAKLRAELGDEQYNARAFDRAAAIFDHLIADGTFVEFLTLPAYDQLAG